MRLVSIRSRACAVALALTACHASTTPTPTPTPTPPPSPPTAARDVPVTLAAVGLEAESLDRTADPCVDFFQFACGGWLAKNEIPADRASWSRWAEIDEHTKVALRALLDADASGARTDATSKQLGDYYAACMDDAAVDRAGLTPVKAFLATAAGVTDARSWFAALVELHAVGMPAVWSVSASADAKDSTQNVLYLDVAGLELPDRDYYLLPAFHDKVDAYRVHIGKVLALTGMPRARTAAAATDVIAIETELAKLTMPAAERRDITLTYNPTDAAGLAAQVKSVDWAAYWKALGITPSAKLILGTPKFFAELDALRARFTPAQWASYFTYHAVSWQAFSLGTAVDAEDLELQKVLTGVTERPARWKRCIDDTTYALGELLGQQYVAANFPDAAKASASRLVDAVAAAVGDGIGGSDWMSSPTKQYAAGKLAKLVRMIGYPDKWRAYDFAIKRDDFAGNELRAWAFETHRVLARAGTPVDRAEWRMNAFTVNAYYETSVNNTGLPAGILQPPLFGVNRSLVVNLGSIGWVIGHELTHGFDDQGALFDDTGNLVNWWQPADKVKFDAKGTCVADQYSAMEELPKQFVNGRLTLGENIADLGGVKAAFRAYRTLRADAATHDVADGFTEDQQFFLAIGQGDCTKNRPAEIQRLLTIDQHAPAELRLSGPLRNLPAFAAAFHCAPGTPMHPVHTCSVW